MNEPQAIQAHIQLLDKNSYQNKIWATRKRPWIDRLASAWLIKTFIDSTPTFIWLETPSECPEEALGFDFDGAAFSHINHWVTFEVLLHSFNLETPALKKLQRLSTILILAGLSHPKLQA